MDALYAHARFEDLDLDAKKAKAKQNSALHALGNKQATRSKLATTGNHFLRDLDLDFTNVYMVCRSRFLFFCFLFFCFFLL